MNDAGIVAFPSFHVLLAILTAVALSAIRWLRIPVWALALLVGISTLTTGLALSRRCRWRDRARHHLALRGEFPSTVRGRTEHAARQTRGSAIA